MNLSTDLIDRLALALAVELEGITGIEGFYRQSPEFQQEFRTAACVAGQFFIDEGWRPPPPG